MCKQYFKHSATGSTKEYALASILGQHTFASASSGILWHCKWLPCWTGGRRRSDITAKMPVPQHVLYSRVQVSMLWDGLSQWIEHLELNDTMSHFQYSPSELGLKSPSYWTLKAVFDALLPFTNLDAKLWLHLGWQRLKHRWVMLWCNLILLHGHRPQHFCWLELLGSQLLHNWI